MGNKKRQSSAWYIVKVPMFHENDRCRLVPKERTSGGSDALQRLRQEGRVDDGREGGCPTAGGSKAHPAKKTLDLSSARE